jgi:hypothetical protein
MMAILAERNGRSNHTPSLPNKKNRPLCPIIERQNLSFIPDNQQIRPINNTESGDACIALFPLNFAATL